ncbi:PREDICTED: transcription factor HBI1 [Nelumbo nucifera]|uniref:Transcription factor HBI1 n=2 Tax=Nelumbo nucifera TaxID=4432 RepID=A0A1U8ALR3_NELNU|nr:PREDICTED: transcription factor HBI1 [Nelumbo nucifera]DAD21627.1 TPA_asm: hypothetical protein HUJ06_023090 [Nelumbo nucifera]
MNTALPEMLHCLQTPPENLVESVADLTMLERKRAQLKRQLQQQQQLRQQSQQRYFGETQFYVFPQPPVTQAQQFQDLINNDPALREFVNRSMKTDPGLANDWPDFGKYPITNTGFGGKTADFGCNGFGTNSLGTDQSHSVSISRTSSCPPAVPLPDEKGRDSAFVATPSTVGRESFKKRKADKTQNTKITVPEDTRDKRIKTDAEETKITVQSTATTTRSTPTTTTTTVTNPSNSNDTTTANNKSNKETTGDSPKDNSKTPEVPKPDYIHVRARRGQATDSHSLAERVRREKISERMKYLQDLVPGCNKITGKAGMLDEIINYVQSLQRQVEFLSMKLAAVNPSLDFNVDNFFGKESAQTFPACNGNSFPTVGLSSEMANPAYLQFNPVQQVVSCGGLDMAINPPDEMTIRRTSSTPISMPEAFLDTTGFTQAPHSSSSWEMDLQGLYKVELQQGRPAAFPTHPFTGTLEANNLKMEM